MKALDYQHVPEFLRVVRAKTKITARALAVTLLAAVRTGEVIGAKWSEVDLEREVWAIPPERLKDRRSRSEPHRVPLSTQVIEVLSKLPRLGEYVFPGQRTGRRFPTRPCFSC